MRKTFTLFILASFLLAACSGSKKLYRKGKKLEKAELIDEAANFYYDALRRNQRNVDARIALKRVGQVQIDNQLNDFYKAHSVKAHKEAVYEYQEALYLQKKYKAFVELQVAAYYIEYYNESLSAYLAVRYDEAMHLLDVEKFEEAEVIFDEITELDPEYKDASRLGLITELEPKYRDGIAAYDQLKYRKSYYLMSEVLHKDPNYKDAIDYKEKALVNAIITVAVVNSKNIASTSNEMDRKIDATLLNMLVNTDNPFVKVVDRDNTKQIMAEQNLSLSGAVDQSTAIDVGELLGAEYLLTGEVLSYSKRGGALNTVKKQGYHANRIKVKGEDGKDKYVTQYQKTYYNETTGSIEVYCSFRFQLISAESGEVVSSDVVNLTQRDEVRYATYSGNYENIFPGSFKDYNNRMDSGDRVGNRREKAELQQMFNTNKRTLKSQSEMDDLVSRSISHSIYMRVINYNPDEE